MGFLIGEKQNIITKTISDAEMSSEKMETTVSKYLNTYCVKYGIYY